MGTKLYSCDPDKNVNCKKNGCFINGGPCDSTTDAIYAKEPLQVTAEIDESPKIVPDVYDYWFYEWLIIQKQYTMETFGRLSPEELQALHEEFVEFVRTIK